MKIIKGEPIVIGAVCAVAVFAGFSASKYEHKKEVANSNEVVVETSAKIKDLDNTVKNELPIQKEKDTIKVRNIVYPCDKAKSKIIEEFNSKCIGMQRNYLEVMKYTPDGKDSFPGVVFKTNKNSVAYASVDGVIRKIQKNNNGDYVEIESSNGLSIIYVGLSKIYVRENEEVKRGQKIGEIGNINNVLLNNKLRFYVLDNNKVIDPMKYMEK